MVVLPPAPGEKPRGNNAVSFEELIDGASQRGSDEPIPVVLPQPPLNRGRSRLPAEPAAAEPAAQHVSAQSDFQQPESANLGETQPIPATRAIPATRPIPATPTSAESEAFGPSGAALLFGDYEPISVTGGEGDSRRIIPWIIVVGGAIAALLAAFFIVSAITSGNEPSQPPAASPGDESETDGTNNGDAELGDSNGNGGTDSGSDSDEPAEPEPDVTEPGTEVPPVEVGPTQSMDIGFWNTQVDVAHKIGLSVWFEIDAEQNLVLSSSLIDAYVAECGGRWGMTRTDAGLVVLKPAERCATQPEVYDELWGLMDAMVKSARPL